VLIYGLVCALVVEGSEVASGTATAFVTRSGDSFQYGGQAFRSVGFNVRGACHYGYGGNLLLYQECLSGPDQPAKPECVRQIGRMIS
jgi:hypothetical protein